jgi:hypothetical protein
MKRTLSLSAVAFLALALCVPVVNASIIGLYYYDTGDRLSVFMKDGRSFLKIEVPNFQNLPQCHGFQLYPRTPFQNRKLELVRGAGGKGTGFSLWESKECTDAYLEVYLARKKMPTRSLVQEIDVYNDFFAHFTNHEDLVRGFEKGEFFLAVIYQTTSRGKLESARQQVFYTYQDVINGKVLLGKAQ